MQLLIIDNGHKLYKPLRYPNDFNYINVSDKDLLCYNFGEDDSNYNNRSVSNYTYSSFKPIDFCHVKKHTGGDLVLGSDCHPSAKPMLPCYPNNNKLKPNILSGVKDCHIEENKISTISITVKEILHEVAVQSWIEVKETLVKHVTLIIPSQF